MSTLSATVTMLQAMPEEARREVFEFTRRLLVAHKPNNPFIPLTQEQILSDLQESRNQIMAGKGLDMKDALVQLRKKVWIRLIQLSLQKHFRS